MTADEARKIQKDSIVNTVSEDAAKVLLKEIYQVIENAARKAQNSVVISDNPDAYFNREIGLRYWNPWRYFEDPDNNIDSRLVHKYIENELEKNGFNFRVYSNGMSHLEITW